MARQNEPAKKIYRGVWAVLAKLFRVPERAPTLLALGDDEIESFRPSPSFLAYLKFQFWIALLGIDLGLGVLWILLLLEESNVAILLFPIFLFLIVAPEAVAYVALHLRYDTTWYVMSGRSLRIRRGIWVIRETTITFENVQNVEMKQGPLQRYFKIANLIVQTAGGGGSVHPAKGHQTNPHLGLIEGVHDAQRIRDVIMTRVRQSRRAGLGDEHRDEVHGETGDTGWTREHLDALRGIRDQVVAMTRRGRAKGTSGSGLQTPRQTR